MRHGDLSKKAFEEEKEKKNWNQISPFWSSYHIRSCERKLWNSPPIFYILQFYNPIRHSGTAFFLRGPGMTVIKVEEQRWSMQGEKYEMERKIEARLWRFGQAGVGWERCKMKDGGGRKDRAIDWERCEGSVTKWFCGVLAPLLSPPDHSPLRSGNRETIQRKFGRRETISNKHHACTCASMSSCFHLNNASHVAPEILQVWEQDSVIAHLLKKQHQIP